MENKKYLKIISTVDEDCEKVINCKKQKGAIDRNSWWYLHGDLENYFHYDKAVVYNLDEFPELRRKVINWSKICGDITEVNSFRSHYEMYCNGIYPVKMYGISEPCVGYFWTSRERKVTAITTDGKKKTFLCWNQRGLVCLEKDTEAREYALKKLMNKSENL